MVDLNLGWPAKRVVKCNGGSGLLKDLPVIQKIFESVRAAVEAGADAVGFVLTASPRVVSPSQAASLLSEVPAGVRPIGVFRDVQRPEYAEETQRQLAVAQERSGPGDLKKLLRSGATWTVE